MYVNNFHLYDQDCCFLFYGNDKFVRNKKVPLRRVQATPIFFVLKKVQLYLPLRKYDRGGGEGVGVGSGGVDSICIYIYIHLYVGCSLGIGAAIRTRHKIFCLRYVGFFVSFNIWTTSIYFI